MPEYRAQVQVKGNAPVSWEKAPTEQEEARREFDKDARKRVETLHAWLENLNALIGSVRTWARDFGWDTKVIEKPMEDAEIGIYKAPALLLQEETTRVLLEPIARGGPGSEGLVDLYLMPAYDDIASLYYYDSRWNIHYMAAGHPIVGDIRHADAKPLSKVSLRKVLDELKSHAE